MGFFSNDGFFNKVVNTAQDIGTKIIGVTTSITGQSVTISPSQAISQPFNSTIDNILSKISNAFSNAGAGAVAGGVGNFFKTNMIWIIVGALAFWYLFKRT